MTHTQNKINAKNNKRFERLTASQKRVMIAKDVLIQLKLQKIKPCTGSFCEITNSKKFNREVIKESDAKGKFELSKVIKNVTCNTCALGALFVSGLNIFNNAHMSDKDKNFGIEDDIHFGMDDKIFNDTLSKYFGSEQLELIESFFEGNCGHFETDEEYNYLVEIFYRLPKEKRLVEIMKNIISNNGTFVPEKWVEFKFQ